MADKTLELALRIVAEATGKQNIEQLVTELKNIEQSADAANPAADKLSESLNQTDTSAKQTSQTKLDSEGHEGCRKISHQIVTTKIHASRNRPTAEDPENRIQ